MAMSPEEIDLFLGSVATVFIGYAGPDGILRATALDFTGDRQALALHDATMIAPGAKTCAIADTYPVYDQIKGVMLRGTVRHDGAGRRLHVEKSSGFDFSKTVGA